MKAGDRFLLQSAGGGGYGDPKARDPQALARDFEEGRVTGEAAAEITGEAVNCVHRQCEAQSDEAIQEPRCGPDCFALLAMMERAHEAEPMRERRNMARKSASSASAAWASPW